MFRKKCSAIALVTLFALALLCAVQTGGVNAQTGELKPTDEGKAEKFKGKTFDLNAKGEAAILLSCPGGKAFTATTKGAKETDVHLFIYSAEKKEVGKDTSPGPKCEIKYTPAKDGQYKFLVRNLGPGANKVTLEVKLAK